MDLGIADRVALVVGGGRGIGRAVALALAREGADVAVLSRTAAELESTALAVRAMGRRALALPLDATDLAALDKGLDELRRVLGPPTLVVLGAAALYEQAAALHPGNADLATGLARMRLRQSRVDEARRAAAARTWDCPERPSPPIIYRLH